MRPKAAIQSSYPYSHYCTPTHTHNVNKAVTSDVNKAATTQPVRDTQRARGAPRGRPPRVVWQWPACTAVQTNVRYDLPLCVHAALPRMTITITPTHPQDSPRLSRNRHATRGTTRSYPTAWRWTPQAASIIPSYYSPLLCLHSIHPRRFVALASHTTKQAQQTAPSLDNHSTRTHELSQGGFTRLAPSFRPSQSSP